MNSRRPYIDTLNAGRQRKPEASLEQLSRSLQHLEQQLDMRERGKGSARPAYDPYDAAPEPAAPRAPAYGRTDPYANADAISSEMRALREEMRQQMSAGLRREFETLRQGMEGAQASSYDRGGNQIAAEIERLADMVHGLSARQDDKPINSLRLELEQVKATIAALAREETVRSVGARWDDIDRKLAAIQSNISAPYGRSDHDPAFAALNERLEQIGASVDHLPESLAINRLDDKMRNLASAIDHFSRQQEKSQPTSLSAIEGRLEEISRAIVATSMTPQAPAIDPRAFDRIETRLNVLARQFDEADRPTDEMIGRLNLLSQRVEEIAQNASQPDKGIEHLSFQVAMLAERVAESSAPSQNDDVLHNIERRLGDVARRLDATPAQPVSGSDDAILGMQRRLDLLAQKIDDSHRGSDVDPGLIQSLEAQLGALSGYLSNPQPSQSGLADIAPRLDRIEASLADSRNEIMQAARKAAEQ